jgi:glyoxylase-like metal-dependent hydrolase (beta-lactamase superfamily II)
VDTGYSAELAARRGRTFLADPIETLREAGVDPHAVSDVVLTLLHYDHAGNLPAFPQATVHLHRAELGPPSWQLGEAAVSFAYDADHVAAVERAAAEERLHLVENGGPTGFAPGIELHHLPGHTPGHLGVRVATARGWLLLAGDSVHVEANLRQRRPFPLYTDLAATFRDYDRVLELAGDLDHVIAGHEPSVIERYPALSPELAGRVARLDLEPDRAG